MLGRRAVLASGASVLSAPAILGRARAAGTIIKMGSTMPYSGPERVYASIGKAEVAFFKWVNDQGGIEGHQVDLISLDDGYSPARTVADTRNMIERQHADFLFSPLGTATNVAIEHYCNQNKIPQLFVATGADRWSDYRKYPWTIGWRPSYRTEAQIYVKYMMAANPKTRLAILYQNDDFGRDYPNGIRDILGSNWGTIVTKALTYEVTDVTVDSQITELRASGADALLVAATPKFAVQAIRKTRDLNWHPLFFLTNASVSVAAVMRPAGMQNDVGIVTALFLKDAADPSWNADAGMMQFKSFMAKYLPDADLGDDGYITGFGLAHTMWKTLQQCKGDYARANIMKQATHLRNLGNPVLLPGIAINTSPHNYRPIMALQPARWTGTAWERFGRLIEGNTT